jgi:deoxyribonuclease V
MEGIGIERREGRSVPHVRNEMRHPWRVTPEEAEAIQRQLAGEVVLQPFPATGEATPKRAAGVDVGYNKDGSLAWAAAVVLESGHDVLPEFKVVERVVLPGEPDMPYRTGLLAFREGRLTIEALESLETEPDLIFCDGHGVVHERAFGLASHVGVLLGIPTIGVPKTPFHAVERQPGPERGDFVVYTKEWGAEGAAIRLRAGTKPVYVSPGHLVDLPSAIALALAWSTGRHRVPEPLSAADTLSKLARHGT